MPDKRMSRLSDAQRAELQTWRKEAVNCGHVFGADRIRSIEEQLRQWEYVNALPKNSKFFEPFELVGEAGERIGAKAWRGLCHWLWLRHECAHALFFTPANLVLFQRRAASVADSPGYLDMTVAGHVGVSDVQTALQSEAKQEACIDLSGGSDHVADSEDLQPVRSYQHIDMPRADDEFYNIECRYVFAIRLTSTALAELRPLDKEVSCFLMSPLEDACRLMQGPDVASALRFSGPLALYHAMTKWF
jgi:isopentenyldiphosphate isomerase